MTGMKQTRCRASGQRRAGARRQRGAAIAEIVVVLPMLLLVGLSTIQFALIYEAKATLNYAALMAARAGAVSEMQKDPMRRAFARAITPLYSPSKNAGSR
ncbi:MAG: TadE/TadG family type IV pilus assembly protein, partial [Gammaproteobacteria bacterium]